MKIMPKFLSRHLVRLQGKLKLKKEKKNYMYISFIIIIIIIVIQIFLCPSHQLISLADLG